MNSSVGLMGTVLVIHSRRVDRDQDFARELRELLIVGSGARCLSKRRSQARCYCLHITHNLLQFSDNVESIATQTTLVLAFGLHAGDKSFRVFHPVRTENPNFSDVKSSPQRTLCISMLERWRRSITRSGRRVSSDCQHGVNNITDKSDIYLQTLRQSHKSFPSHHHERVPCHSQELAV